MGREHGVTEAQLRDLAEFETSDAFSEPRKLALRYATAMTATPVELPLRLVTVLRTEILELDGVSGLTLDVTSKPPGTIEWE